MPSRPPRYAIVGARGYPSTYGGFETFVRRLAPFLVSEGAEVTVYGRGATLWPRAETVGGVRVLHTPGIDRTSTSTLTYGLTAIAHAAVAGYDAVLVLNVANGYWLPLLRLAGIPSLVNVDGIEWERGKWSSLGKAVFRRGAHRTARTADRIVVDSRAIGHYWRRAFDVPSVFIPYGADVDLDDSADRVEDMGLDTGGYLLVVARLVPENNVDLVLDALEMLDGRYPIVIVGSSAKPSSLDTRLAHLARTRSGFTWLGHVDDQILLRQLWRHCGLYLHGHSVGGTNPALLQALGAGAPTVALDTVYNREVLGADWPIFPPGRPELLAQLITSLMADDRARGKLATRGQAIVESSYRWDDVLAQYSAALRVLSGSRA